MNDSRLATPKDVSKLIATIHEKASFWDSLAENDALKAVRNPDENLTKAKESVARVDSAHKLRDEVTESLWAWFRSLERVQTDD